MATRIGVDIGGTFTDLIYYDDQNGEVQIAKVPTTTGSLDDGVVEAVSQAVPARLISEAAYFLHGTTIGLNALLQRRGEAVGLLATKGFRDILEIRRGDRDEMYNLFWKPPPPLVPRWLRLPVRERIGADGQVIAPLDSDDLRQAVEIFNREGVESVAVAFINAYANPAHELEAERILRQSGFDGALSLSHRVSGEYREYERTTTTVIDAFVRRPTTRYLRQLGRRLAALGLRGDLMVTRSGGGSMTFAEAEERPFETIMSGPVAGVEGAGELARQAGTDTLITADVGGTSFDTAVVLNGRPQLMYEGRVVGLPVQTPWVDVRSIGAGGGSIAYVDRGGLLRVGPQSAGAQPGPASYGRGGTEPTVTDAALVLGMLGRGELAGGISLDCRLAEDALHPTSKHLGLSVRQTAQGIMRIAAAGMADVMREITIDQGHDPRRMRLLAFGGAGPLLCTLLAREIDVPEVLVPSHAGNFSAWGLLGGDATQATSRTRIMPLSDESLDTCNNLLQSMFAELEVRQSKGFADRASVRGVGLDMRYSGQEHSLTVTAENDEGRIALDADRLQELFDQEYKRTFGIEMEEEREIVSIRAVSRIPLPRRQGLALSERQERGHEHADGTAEAYSFTKDAWCPFDLLERRTLEPGACVRGPAIISEPTATSYLDAGFEARVEGSGGMLITRTGETQ